MKLTALAFIASTIAWLPFGFANELKPAAWVPLPAVGSSPETGYQYGAYVMRIFPQQTPNVPQNRLELLLQGTAQGQYQAYLWPNVFLNDGNLQVKGSLGGRYWPSTYYGEGNSTALNGDPYSDTTVESAVTMNIKSSTSVAYGGSLFAEYHKIENLNDSAATLLLNSSISGSQGGFYSGIGLNVALDTRDNIDWPSMGQSVLARLDWYSPAIGSDINFNLLAIDVSHYIALADDVIALSASVNFASKKTPFTHLPRPSGDRTLRGANGQRWRDNRSLGLQSEYRKVISNRWAVVGFIDTFQVADQLSDLTISHFHVSTGVGARFAMTPDRFNIRFDIGWVDADSFNLAISVGEAF